MKLIIGLGNPGINYFNTRHNIGFEAVDKLINIYNVAMSSKHKSLVGIGTIGDFKVMFVKPQTYMNLSGDAAREIVDYYKIPCEDVTVIHDDLDVPVGKIKIKHNGSSGGHNGVKDIICKLGTENFNRVRIGIGKKTEGWQLNDYVLGKFPPEQKLLIDAALNLACESVKFIISDVFMAMNKFNVRK